MHDYLCDKLRLVYITAVKQSNRPNPTLYKLLNILGCNPPQPKWNKYIT